MTEPLKQEFHFGLLLLYCRANSAYMTTMVVHTPAGTCPDLQLLGQGPSSKTSLPGALSCPDGTRSATVLSPGGASCETTPGDGVGCACVASAVTAGGEGLQHMQGERVS